ncbi:NUDIX hydrolase [Streptomyces sp. NBC_01317]|uniref:NUDIX hydrolase n=1 Tax=Streptomyces sp. NBC_01317 TaxID=2903822 RepID=UPI002E137A13|nr:NUDIX hydrolase [Streptomyces sp. NBC_01317]
MREIGSETVHRNPWFSVLRKRYEDGVGDRHAYFMVSKPDSVLVVVRHEDRFVVVDLPRQTFGGARSVEFPQGGIEAGESPESAARREVLEETGLRVTDLRHLGTFAESSGFSTTSCHAYSARAVAEAGATDRDPFEESMTVRTLSWPELRQLARDGGIQDSATLAALALAEVLNDDR